MKILRCFLGAIGCVFLLLIAASAEDEKKEGDGLDSLASMGFEDLAVLEKNEIAQHQATLLNDLSRINELRQDDPEKAAELIAIARKQNMTFVERLRAIRERRRTLEAELNGNPQGKDYIEVPALPDYLADMQKELEAIEQSAPWVENPDLEGENLARAWFAWKKQSKPHWEKIRAIKNSGNGNLATAERLDAVIAAMPPGVSRDLVAAIRNLEEDGGPTAVAEAMADPTSEISQLRDAQKRELRRFLKDRSENQ
jgi:hypothetical protein